jgi:hypothetical protein
MSCRTGPRVSSRQDLNREVELRGARNSTTTQVFTGVLLTKRDGFAYATPSLTVRNYCVYIEEGTTLVDVFESHQSTLMWLLKTPLDEVMGDKARMPQQHSIVPLRNKEP